MLHLAAALALLSLIVFFYAKGERIKRAGAKARVIRPEFLVPRPPVHIRHARVVHRRPFDAPTQMMSFSGELPRSDRTRVMEPVR